MGNYKSRHHQATGIFEIGKVASEWTEKKIRKATPSGWDIAVCIKIANRYTPEPSLFLPLSSSCYSLLISLSFGTDHRCHLTAKMFAIC